MKKNIDKVLFVIVSIIIIIFLIMFLVSKKESFSEEENRYLAKFDIKNIDDYIVDHFPFRKELISLKNHTKKFVFKTFISNVYLAKDNYLIPDYVENKNKDYIVSSVNNFAKNIKNVDVLIVPDSILINSDKMYFNNSRDEEKEINYLYSKMKNTNNINVIEALKLGNKDNQMYYKTDHHWTSYGAYTAYKEYFRKKGKVYYIENDFNINKVSNNFLGTSSSLTYGLANKEDIFVFEKDNDLSVNYVLENKQTCSLYNYDYLYKKDKYSMFLDNNHALVQITNKSINNDSKILIIKNSFGNSFVPFIVNHYNETYVIDLRYYSGKVSDYVINNNITDILILYNLNNMYSDMSLVKLK